MTPTIGVPEVLARSRRVISPAMTAAIERLAPEIRRVVSYHMGWTDAAGNPIESPGGKGIRPTLAMLAAEAAWAEPEVGVPGGVAVELVHNFSLIHDDIIDTDAERHHRPTVWATYGIGPAIVAGDAMQILAHQVLLESPSGQGAAASAALADATAAMIAGQADDIAFEARGGVTVEQCMAMSSAKTGALLGCAASIGAILAGAPAATVGALRDYGRHLGLAFQAVDDLLGIWGDPARTGKPAGSDLRQRKKSMPVVAALAAGGPESDEFRELIVGPLEDAGRTGIDVAASVDTPAASVAPRATGGAPTATSPAASTATTNGANGAAQPKPGAWTVTAGAAARQGRRPLDADQIARATYLVEACGGREWTAVRAKANLDAALGALERVRLSAIPHRDLADIAVFVVEARVVNAVATGAPTDHLEQAAAALGAARDHLLKRQDPAGWWKAELQTNVTMDAEDLLLRHFLGILEPEVAAASARWIRSQQQPDGTWNSFHGGPPDLSTTIEAYVALRLTGDAVDAPHLGAAAEFVRTHGGLESSRVFTRIWMALVGRWDWEDLPVLPPEIMFLPPSVPLNIYDFGCWARQTIVALTIVMAHRPARPLPFGLDELRAAEPPATSSAAVREAPGSAPRLRRRPPAGPAGPDRPGLRTAAGRFLALDRLLHAYERLPRWFVPRPLLRRAALLRAEQWIIKRQEADGLWGGIQPPVVYSIMALELQGYPLDHPVLRAALAGLDDFVIRDDNGRRVEACQSPVWDTALALVALADAGIDPEHPALAMAVRWLLGEEITVAGDWAVRRPDLAPGGWAFEFANDNYPDIDDTAEVVLALRRAGRSADADTDAACRRGAAWTIGMQSRDGGWGAFDVDNDSPLVAALPFCDFGEVTDPPSADVTAHVIEMLAEEPDVPPDVLRAAIAWLSGQQERDGSWFGRWGVNYVYGTGAAVPALVAAGVAQEDPRIRRAVDWLARHQNPDGGWGEDLRSYVDDQWRGRGESTASQTAWALLALIAAGEARAAPARRGVEWLLATQRPDGTWDEPWFTGTGFPWDFTINYHLYRLVWPLMALGRYLRAAGGAPP